MNETPTVGGETLAWCTTCKTMSEHVIVALVDGKPAKVECDSCHKQHLYRDAPGASKKSSGGRAKRAAAPAAPAPPPIDLAAITAGQPRTPYNPKERLAPGQVVEHPTFGVGLVTMVVGPQKVEIAFQAGAKLLAHDRATAAAGGLKPPPRREDDGPPPPSDAPLRQKL